MQCPSGPNPGPSTLAGRIWQQARPMIAAALVAQLVIVVLSEFVAPAPLLTAMLGTFAFSAVWLHFAPHQSARARASPLALRDYGYTAGLITGAVLLGTLFLATILGNGNAFYCEPAVPWRVEIAIFGSFAIGLLTRIAQARGRVRLVYPLTLIGFLWIAPFYGFFSGPVFLATGLLASCTNRSDAAVLLAAFGMAVGEQLGVTVGQWLSPPPTRRSNHLDWE